jgi:uncharacterized protein (DUF952 family)
MSLIYKILPREAFEAAKASGAFVGAGIDLADGSIHFSTALQVHETARLHFRDKPDLVIFSVESEELGEALKWEPSRGGQMFPHLYGPLDVALIREAAPAPLGADGAPVLPFPAS